jgi:hypothetical protein
MTAQKLQPGQIYHRGKVLAFLKLNEKKELTRLFFGGS